MKFFICGCNGMAGHTISLYLREQGYEVFGFDLKESTLIPSIACNAFNTETLRKVIAEGNYDTVINCIGILNQFAEQNHALASYINSYFPHFLADVTKGTNTQIIHMSTDCVFSGTRGDYVETDHRDNETFYGRSKALGELDDDKNVTLRDSIVGPDTNPNGLSLLNWFMAQENEINGFTNKMWTGLTTLELAKAMEVAAKERVHGIFNCVPDHSISKYELISLFNHYLKNDTVKINPVKGTLANFSLKRTRFELSYIVSDYDTQIRELAEWIKLHKDMYPHYNL
ncbi:MULTISPECIES: sugar nucleotide-binding protein [Bacteroides]|jgi:dTDP-4-dehydrorhamnose reductase|uniref:dTDP-4-dehydrorhamnose reductase n=1 Tax=Bacteroides uniformis TaxID=820 RepID=A0A412JKR6_BACUN|nr:MULTISPECIES: sugar nucleotide-binding protein [Bacteroides]RGS52934.1 NAD-dependent epimerase/dehydratase family protein [Bacteroides uniformis]RJV41722.1 NAD-dependent epimerase/dehydratase family protein [Bacteroides sp. AF25-38AC]